MEILNRDFFERDTLLVARQLLGTELVRQYDGHRLSGMVIETEAYLGADDSASHAFRGKTPRNQIMYGPAGIAYVYFTYGMHHLLNVVTEARDNPRAVLLRAIMPLRGQRQMEALRGKRGRQLANGPAKLCQALAIDLSHNAWDLTRGKQLWLQNHNTIPENFVGMGPRIGIGYAALKDRDAPWRFWVRKDIQHAHL